MPARLSSLPPVLFATVLIALCTAGCAAPVTTTPTAGMPTPTVAIATKLPVPSAAISTPSAPLTQTVIANWEEMFRATQSYEYVKANGRPDDKEWWTEQAKRFYMGRARAVQQQQIELMFWPGARMTPGFIQDARYVVEVQNCPSATECALQVRVQSGKYWAYDISRKSWNEAGPVEPVTGTVSMRYDSTADRWMIN